MSSNKGISYGILNNFIVYQLQKYHTQIKFAFQKETKEIFKCKTLL